MLADKNMPRGAIRQDAGKLSPMRDNAQDWRNSLGDSNLPQLGKA